MLDESHYFLKFILAIDHPLFHKLKSLGHQFQLVNNFVQGLLYLRLELPISDPANYFLRRKLLGMGLRCGVIKDISFVKI